ncbi:hypothetical protein JHK82_024965 [Glycine max]|nr:hypothetical protein JHK82_024965 [Glycine max]
MELGSEVGQESSQWEQENEYFSQEQIDSLPDVIDEEVTSIITMEDQSSEVEARVPMKNSDTIVPTQSTGASSCKEHSLRTKVINTGQFEKGSAESLLFAANLTLPRCKLFNACKCRDFESTIISELQSLRDVKDRHQNILETKSLCGHKE